MIPVSVVVWWVQVDVPWWPKPVYSDQLILRLWCCAHRSQHLCSGRPGHRLVKENLAEQPSPDGVTATSVFECVKLVFPVGTGTSFDYIREFRRSTGTWHRTKPMLPNDLSKTVCAALRIANCRLFRLQLSQGMFRIRVWHPYSHTAHWYFLLAVGLGLRNVRTLKY